MWRTASVWLAVVLVAALAGFLVTRAGAPAQPGGRLVQTAGTPVTGLEYSIAPYPPAAEVVMFGGIDSGDQTWIWSAGHWSRVSPATSPQGRLGAAAAYDPVLQETMLYGGRLSGGQEVDDTWGWNGSGWQELDMGSGSPPSGEGGSMAWDPGLNQMFLVHPVFSPGVSGQTWVWNGSGWTRQTQGDFPAGVEPIGLVYDTAAGELLALGSNAIYGTLDVKTYEWSGVGWTQVPGQEPDTFSGTAFDAAGRQLLLTGPDTGPESLPGTSTFRLTSGGWQRVGAVTAPPYSEGLVTDPAGAGQALLFGTEAPASQVSPQPLHVWAWSRGTWVAEG